MSLTQCRVIFLCVKELVLQVHVPVVLPPKPALGYTWPCFRASDLLSEERDFGPKPINDGLFVPIIVHLLELRLALNGSGSLRILYGIQGLAQVELGGSDASNHVGNRVASKRVLQEARELGITIRDKSARVPRRKL